MNEKPKIEEIKPKSNFFASLQKLPEGLKELPKTAPALVQTYAKHEDIKKRYIFWGAVGIFAVLVIFLILYFSGVSPLGSGGIFQKKVEDSRPTARNAFDIALLEAQKWQPDARLAYMNSGPVGETGRSDVWKAIFTSPKIKDKGLEVEVADYKVVSKTEIPITKNIGADFPVEVISPEEAIAQVRQTPGYEKAEIYGVEVIRAPVGNSWSWGVKTNRGVVAIKAEKK